MLNGRLAHVGSEEKTASCFLGKGHHLLVLIGMAIMVGGTGSMGGTGVMDAEKSSMDSSLSATGVTFGFASDAALKILGIHRHFSAYARCTFEVRMDNYETSTARMGNRLTLPIQSLEHLDLVSMVVEEVEIASLT